MLAYRRVGILLAMVFAVVAVTEAFSASVGLAAFAVVTSLLLAYVVVFAMRLRVVLRGDAGDTAIRIRRAVDASVPRPWRVVSKHDQLIVHPTDLYRIQFKWRREGTVAIVEVEADAPLRGVFERRPLLDRSVVWDRLLAALKAEGFSPSGLDAAG
jgi:hypothetical protein